MADTFSYVINVMSDDHPGIVAAVTRAIHDLGGNIADCSQTVVGGYFTLIMIAAFPERMAPDALAAKISGTGKESERYQVQVGEALRTSGNKAAASDRFVLTASGADRPGIILEFTSYLADKGINIIDLYGALADQQFMLVAQVEVPRDWELGMIQAELAELGSENDYTVRCQHENVFVATNQLRLPRQR